MAGLTIVSKSPLSGKTTVLAGLARRLKSQNTSFSLTREGDGGNAADDTAFFARLGGGSGGIQLTEAEAGGDIAQLLTDHAGSRVIILATPEDSPAEMAGFVRSGGPVVGVIVNRVPAKRAGAVRAAYEAAGIQPLMMLAEDQELASPTLGQTAEALGAETEHVEAHSDRSLDRPVIASIAADPGQTYFSRTGAETVIVRSDKPDLQLAALNAGASCLIVTGGLPVLSYVLERVQEDEIPLLRTGLDTKQAVTVIEELLGSAPFRGDDKTRRAASLLSELDLEALFERTAV